MTESNIVLTLMSFVNVKGFVVSVAEVDSSYDMLISLNQDFESTSPVGGSITSGRLVTEDYSKSSSELLACKLLLKPC
jgi:hypothetical protein